MSEPAREPARDLRDMSFRELSVRAAGDDKPVRAVLSTEQPVEMYDWERGEFVPEVLLMSGMELPASRQIPLLDCHQRWTIKDQLGSVVDIRTHGAGGGVDFDFADGELRFDDTEDGQNAEKKVRGGHVTDTSIGYKILESTYVAKGESAVVGGKSFEGPVNVRTKWRINEDSLCPIGADDLAKVRGFRSFAEALERGKKDHRDANSGDGLTPGASPSGDDKPRESRSAPENQPDQPKTTMSEPKKDPDFDEKAARAQIEESISKTHAEILAIGDRIKDKDWAYDQIAKGRSLEEVKTAALDKMADENGPVTTEPQRSESLDLGPKEVRHYDLSAALADHVKGERIDKKHSLVGEISEAISDRTGKPLKGIFIPGAFDFGRDQRERWEEQKRDLLAGTATDGQELVPTEHGADRFVPVLRPMPVMGALGAETITGVVGNWDVPKETTSPSASTKAEAVAHTESEGQFGTISYTPHAYGFFTEVSDRLIRQGSPAVVQIIRNRMNREVTIAMDADGINGSGTNEAEGIINATGVGTVTITTAGQPDFDEILEFEQDIADANADGGTVSLLTTNAIRKHLKKTAEYGTDRDPIWDKRTNEVNGYAARASNQVPANGIIQGDFSFYWFCVWDGIEIVQTKDSDQAKKRMTQFTVNLDLDGHLTVPTAFSTNA